MPPASRFRPSRPPRAGTTARGDGAVPFPASAEHRLAVLEGKAEAVESHLILTRRQVGERIDERREAVRTALAGLRASMAVEPGLAPRDKHTIGAAMDDLARRLGHGRARSALAIASLRDRTGGAIADLESELASAVALGRRPLGAAGRHALRRYRRAAEDLATELDVALSRLHFESGSRGADLARRRRDLAVRIAALKLQIARRRESLAGERERTAAAWRGVESRVASAVERMSRSLDRWLGAQAR